MRSYPTSRLDTSYSLTKLSISGRRPTRSCMLSVSVIARAKIAARRSPSCHSFNKSLTVRSIPPKRARKSRLAGQTPQRAGCSSKNQVYSQMTCQLSMSCTMESTTGIILLRPGLKMTRMMMLVASFILSIGSSIHLSR